MEHSTDGLGNTFGNALDEYRKLAAEKQCPSCGHCPTCGRGRGLMPMYPTPYNPTWPQTTTPWWGVYPNSGTVYCNSRTTTQIA